MKIVEKSLGIEPAYNFDKMGKEQIVFFDIETTGLSADTSVLYLIGAVYYNKDNWKFVQWFADDSDDERKIIEEFFRLIENRKYLVNYNGNGFDIPYIKKKIKQLRLTYTFDTFESIDLYKTCKKYRDVMQLDNCKLKTLEQFWGIYREDKYSGKELIDTYKNFIKIYTLEKIQENYGENKYEKSEPLLNELLLHNEEDIINLLEITRINYFDDLAIGNVLYKNYEINENFLILNYDTNISKIFTEKKKCIKIDNETTIITLEDNILQIKTLIKKDEMKFFFTDYKNYYYLPLEDMAMHKSIATFVDKEHRQQAKASNCYLKKKGEFVYIYSEIGVPVFKQNYDDTQCFCLLEDIKKMNLFDIYGKEQLNYIL